MLGIRVADEFEYECLESGQQRRYADSWYKYRVTDLADVPRDRNAVLAFCKTTVKKAYAKADRPYWSSPTVMRYEQDMHGDWIYHVCCEYTG